MITAKEAFALYQESGYEADEFIENELQPKIIRAAKEGKRIIFHSIDSCVTTAYLSPSPLQMQVSSKLIDLGYDCKIIKHGSSYVPAGLSDDYGEGPSHVNYGFQIGW